MIRRALLLLLVVGGALAIFGPGASANSTVDHVSNWGVTQYLTVDYNENTCGGFTGYQIYKVSAKWVRGSTNQEVADDNYNAGILAAIKCGTNSGYNVSDNKDFSFAAMNNWSCPDGYHSCSVSRSYSWPYVRWTAGAAVGANLKGHIYNRGNDTFYGYLCTFVYKLGSGGCP